MSGVYTRALPAPAHNIQIEAIQNEETNANPIKLITTSQLPINKTDFAPKRIVSIPDVPTVNKYPKRVWFLTYLLEL